MHSSYAAAADRQRSSTALLFGLGPSKASIIARLLYSLPLGCKSERSDSLDSKSAIMGSFEDCFFLPLFIVTQKV
jgi:hypothetical protein